MFNKRTDLAVEARDMYREDKSKEIPGVEVDVSEANGIKITRVNIQQEVGARIMNKPVGNYITIEADGIRKRDRDVYEEASRTLGEELKRIAPANMDSTTLVVGLGNWNVTPDSLGPKTISHLMVTRHVFEYLPDQVDEGVSPVCAISPGVLGITGIETGEIIEGIVFRIKPDRVIAIDALASRKMERINSTIQIADTGISPGSGVGNKRKELNRETLGVPVIAIGVPTVVDAATMASDTIDMVVDTMLKQADEGKEFYQVLQRMKGEDRYNLIREVLDPNVGSLVVTPKEIDDMIRDMSKILANGLNIYLHPSIGPGDVDRFIN
ncbi:MAG: GPR endopeptidase [Bacillota bacterium]|nr:GPR endopeptidase [Bacillota bacterium]MDD3298162.1 GPR endopeptidase [Bacillota bacterium]MDD3850358.1 GPR endopeptidase [Bacillota bacterium]MDD4707950.1 GPR endopeptidase [Bacillota bacterium]